MFFSTIGVVPTTHLRLRAVPGIQDHNLRTYTTS